jgi:leucyl-tRNA synthetase
LTRRPGTTITLRGVALPASASREEIEALAVASADFVKHAGSATPRKVIVVPGRLVNVVV